MTKNWDRLLPIAFYYDHLYEEEQKQISQAINEFYFNNERPNLAEQRDNLTNVRTFYSSKAICMNEKFLSALE